MSSTRTCNERAYRRFNRKPDYTIGKIQRWENHKILHEISYLNSGGVTAKTFYIPLNNFFLSMFDKIYSILSKPFPKIFGLNRCLVLVKK